MVSIPKSDITRAVDTGVKLLSMDNVLAPLSMKGPLSVLHQILVGVASGELEIVPVNPQGIEGEIVD